MSSMAARHTDGAPVLLYDGECGFCNRAVQTILRHDRRASLRFASLASPFARRILARPELDGIDSMVWVECDAAGEATRTWVRSDAALRVARYLGGAFRLVAAAATLVPRPWRDAVYAWVARHRNRRPDGRACLVPTADQRARFIDP
jgi:predicted DCC family thiol-disulfide oxidoreductase YuxK